MKSIEETLKVSSVGERLVRRNPLIYPRARESFRRLTSAGLEERRRFTESRLRSVIRAASRTPYGASSRARESIHDWPLLDKAPLRDHADAFARRPRLAVHARTSGTTGIPVRLFRSLTSVSVEQSAIDHVLTMAGLDPRQARIAVLRADAVDVGTEPSPRYWTDTSGGRRRLFSSRHLSAATVDDFADALAAFEPDCLFAYPSSLGLLCSLLQEHDLSVRIPVTLASSEVLTSATRRGAEAALQTKVIDLYGQAERVALAYALHDGEYYFLPGYAHVELHLHERGDHSDLYEIVGTSLWNLSMPLIRYRTGDLVAVDARLDAADIDLVRYGFRPFREVIGRVDDYLIAPDGARIIGINHIPRGVENILQMQIVQEARDFVRVLVLPKEGFGERDRDRIVENLNAKLPDDMRYTIEAVHELERTDTLRTPFLITRPGLA